MSKTVTVTRRTTVGFGYNAGASQHWNKDMTQSWLAPDETEKPDHIGTISQVEQAISEDRTLASYQSGTQYTSAWFIKVSGKWHKIIGEFDVERMGSLLMRRDKADYQYDGRKYYADSVDVEID